MVSFNDSDCLAMIAEVTQSFALDNGAFSAWNAGAPITDWAPYYDWVDSWRQHPGFDWAIIPDVIDGSEADNDRLVEPCAGSGWVPVWHMHETTERLTRLAKTFERVAISSSGDFAEIMSDRWWDRMRLAMEAVYDTEGRPRTKLHGLRMLDPSVFSIVPLASGDSVNVERNMGHDTRWTGPYAAISPAVRAQVLMERCELHASAAKWSACAGQRNFELVG